MAKTKAEKPTNIVWFNVPTDNLKRAQKFYGGVFGWKITPFRGMKDFLEMDTGGADSSPNGGLTERKNGETAILNYMGVKSLDKSAAKVLKLGGKITEKKTAVPGMGYFAICRDTENNEFGLWEVDRAAK